MPTRSVLVIDDEPQIRRIIRHLLADSGTQVLEAASGAEGISLAASARPALVILDLGLPDSPGIGICKQIRDWSDVPIIVLSARHLDTEKAALLDAGADDYVTKPFSTLELRARIDALLRRSNATPSGDAKISISGADLVIDLAKPAVSRSGKDIHLTRTEWDLLRVLLKHAGRTMTHREIFTAVWSNSFGDAQQNLRVHIRSLRKKLELDSVRPRFIVTEPGVGYRIELES